MSARPVAPGRLFRYLWALPTTLVGAIFLPLALLPHGRLRVVDGVLEMHAPSIRAILCRCVPIGGGAAAMTLGHIVVGCDSRSLDATRRHERVHVRQCEIWGPAFIPAYLMAGFWALLTGRGAYEGNYFEWQARQGESM
jgi:hypothetical protein